MEDAGAQAPQPCGQSGGGQTAAGTGLIPQKLNGGGDGEVQKLAAAECVFFDDSQILQLIPTQDCLQLGAAVKGSCSDGEDARFDLARGEVGAAGEDALRQRAGTARSARYRLGQSAKA